MINGWFHLSSSHRLMLSVLGVSQSSQGKTGSLFVPVLSVFSQKKMCSFFGRMSQIQTLDSFRILSFIPNFIVFSNTSLLCSFCFQIVQTFLALRKPADKESLLTYIFPWTDLQRIASLYITHAHSVKVASTAFMCSQFSSLAYIQASREGNCHIILCFIYFKNATMN